MMSASKLNIFRDFNAKRLIGQPIDTMHIETYTRYGRSYDGQI